jgi:hypothetical protein
MNSYGSRVTALESPPLWDPEVDLRPTSGISSTGWVALRTSSEPESPQDISLTLFHLPEFEVIDAIPLLSTHINESIRPLYDFSSITLDGEDVFLALTETWFKPRWSSCGRYLAFAAALDGESTDVYIYDTQRRTRTRLTEEPYQAMVLGWSPDNR